MIWHINSNGKRVHLYGGAAAMRSDVMPLRDRKCIVSELFVAFSFSFAFAFAFSLPNPLADPFSELWLKPFSDPFSESLRVIFPLPLLLPVMWRGGQSEACLCLCPWEYWLGRRWRVETTESPSRIAGRKSKWEVAPWVCGCVRRRDEDGPQERQRGYSYSLAWCGTS